MKKSRIGAILWGGLFFLTACQTSELPSSPQSATEAIALKLQYDRTYANDSVFLTKNSSAEKVVDANYDHVEMVVVDTDGEVVKGLKSQYNQSTSQIFIEGLQEGDYQLLILGVKGDMNADQAQIHEINTIHDEWLSFPTDLNRPLSAEYYYSLTPFSVVATAGEKGNVLSVMLNGNMVQHRIVGRVDANLSFNSPSVESAVETMTLTLDTPYFSTGFTGEGTFTGRSSGSGIVLDLTDTTSYLFLPTVDKESLKGNIEVNTRSYQGNSVQRSYSFSLEEIAANAIGKINTTLTHPDDQSATVFVTPKMYQKVGVAYILQDGESKTIYTKASERSFSTTKPLQTSVTDEGQLHVRFYSPRPLTNVLLQARVPSVGNEYFDLAYFDSIPAFVDFYCDIPMTTKQTFARTASGQLMEIAPLSVEELKTAEFQIQSNDPYWEKLQAIQRSWTISFNLYGGNPDKQNGGPAGNWMGIRPVHCREVVALFLNITYMIDIPEYEQLLKDNASRLYGDGGPSGALVAPETVMQKLRQSRSLSVGLVYSGNGVVGLGGGTTFGVYQGGYFQHYTSTYACEVIFHELGHVLGYGHSSSFTYGPWAQSITNNFYIQNLSQLPIDSPTYLNSSQNPNKY